MVCLNTVAGKPAAVQVARQLRALDRQEYGAFLLQRHQVVDPGGDVEPRLERGQRIHCCGFHKPVMEMAAAVAVRRLGAQLSKQSLAAKLPFRFDDLVAQRQSGVFSGSQTSVKRRT